MKIMLIDDEESMRILMKHILTECGYEFVSACEGQEGLSMIAHEKPDIIILDVMMPIMSGFQVCRKIREAGIIVPIIFLSAKSDIIDKEEGFEAGGNDYIAKPFDHRELVLRIKAHLRQFKSVSTRVVGHIAFGEIDIDIKRHRITVRGVPVDLTAKEFRIMVILASQPGGVFTREQIVEKAWGSEFIAETSSLPVIIRRIREKIEKDPSRPEYLKTVRGVGYKLEAVD